ncbi:MAG TPA: hypothetical protein VME41_16680 [Stellaceae bacterium]|nr:hypothetical protein [Stellaceae bacterium]
MDAQPRGGADKLLPAVRQYLEARFAAYENAARLRSPSLDFRAAIATAVADYLAATASDMRPVTSRQRQRERAKALKAAKRRANRAAGVRRTAAPAERAKATAEYDRAFAAWLALALRDREIPRTKPVLTELTNLIVAVATAYSAATGKPPAIGGSGGHFARLLRALANDLAPIVKSQPAVPWSADLVRYARTVI